VTFDQFQTTVTAEQEWLSTVGQVIALCHLPSARSADAKLASPKGLS
jgi:hypothetical protein